MTTVYSPLSNTADIIDSRDVIARIEFLERTGVDDDEREEYDALKALAADGENYAPDWEYGATLIHPDYFEDYARQLAEDIGAIDPDAGWPNSYIDWERAADALTMDYVTVTFDGVDYWTHA
jgi:hypothetical protein